MRIFGLLLRRNLMPNGHILIGKHRLVKTVAPIIERRAREDFEQEIENMKYLRFPYLTAEESHCHTTGRKYERFTKFVAKRRKEFKPDVTFEERLKHLKVQETWD